MPTVFIVGKYRFYFFSREERRRHVHVSSPEGEAKVWMEPEISVAKVVNLSAKDINEILELVHSKEEIINAAWEKHFENK